MKKSILKIFTIVLLSFFLMGATQCHTTDTVILNEGPVANQLGKTKDEQIKGLTEQVRAEQEARDLAQKQAALAAANFDGVLFAAEHVETGLPRNAIEEEAKLGKVRLPAPDAQEVIKAKDRVIAILQNEVAKAKELYGKAFDEAKQAKTMIETKDKELIAKNQVILEREVAIAKLEADKAAEIEKHKNDVKKALEEKDKQFADYKKAEAEKERRWLVNAIRITSLGFIVAGVVAMIVFKVIAEGAAAVACGVLIGLIGIFIEWLTNQIWFPWLCGAIIIAVLIAGGTALYKMWLKHNLDDKKTQAIQDMMDEAKAKGDTKAWTELEAHLKYRLGDKDSFWGSRQLKHVAALGLVNPEAEKAEREKLINEAGKKV